MELPLLLETARVAQAALTKIDLHMEQCAEANRDVAGSIRRLHDRMDERVTANRVILVSVLVAAGSSAVQAILHFLH
jgi:hypothetical protein